jgi:Peptidase_C39 like family
VTCAHSASRARCSVERPSTAETAALVPGIAFDGLVPSWNATTPAGAFIEVFVRVRVDGAWSNEYALGVWAGGESAVDRHSIDGQSDALGTVYTDTLFLDAPADAARVRVALHGGATLERLAIAVVATDLDDDGGDALSDGGGLAFGVIHEPPDRSQFDYAAGQAWCSPTSTSMVLGYHASLRATPELDATVEEAAAGTWDSVYEGNGNWPFNTAFAATKGLHAEVGWFGSVAALEPWILAGLPVIISAEWGDGELTAAHISSTNGHLLLVRGFDADGNVAVNDPAAPGDAVSRIYDRQQFRDAWMRGSGGVAYLIWPELRPSGL